MNSSSALSVSSQAGEAGGLPTRVVKTADAVEAALRAELDRWLGGVPQRLGEAIRYALLGPGKRLRPVLLLFSAELAGGTQDDGMPAAVAVEMLHAYSLVHDDLPAMDDDDLRRGRATCHKQFDEGTAILVGDALLTRAFGVLAEAALPAARVAALVRELAAGGGAGGMIGGQAEDLDYQNRPGDLEAVRSIHLHKTAALFASACRMGALSAGGSAGIVEALGEFGCSLGLAFQIADDLLDETGQTEQAGKAVGKDSSAGKLTHVSVAGVAGSRQAAADRVAQAEAALDRVRAAAPAGGRADALLDDLKTLSRYVIERTR